MTILGRFARRSSGEARLNFDVYWLLCVGNYNWVRLSEKYV